MLEKEVEDFSKVCSTVKCFAQCALTATLENKKAFKFERTIIGIAFSPTNCFVHFINYLSGTHYFFPNKAYIKLNLLSIV